jgi:hypothetical protein
MMAGSVGQNNNSMTSDGSTGICHFQSSLIRKRRMISWTRFSVQLSFLLKRIYLGQWHNLVKSQPNHRRR